jgi:hypothetical protein
MIKFLQAGEGSEIKIDLDRKKGQIVITPFETSHENSGVDKAFSVYTAHVMEFVSPSF